MGDVLGGFLAAMLFDTVGPALLATLGPSQFISDVSQAIVATATATIRVVDLPDGRAPDRT